MNKQVSHIPSGYKPSPLGPIPEDWEVKRLGEVGEVFSGGTPNTEIQEYWNGYIDWCTPTDITSLNGAIYIERTALKITDLGLKCSSAVLLPPNSIIVCTRATIGNAAISLHQITTNQGFKNVVPSKSIDTLFLYYTIVNNKIRLIRLGNGSTFLEVSKSDFENLTIPVPPLSEQQRIVSVLSLWDTAIAKQTALIEKLSLRKRGLMQQLLTGKKRLKGFEGEWKEVRLGKCGIFLSNNTLSREQLNKRSGTVQNIHYGDVLIKYPSILDCDKVTLPFINESAYKDSMTDFVKNGDIVISDTAEDETVGKACEVQNIGTNRILAGLHTMLFRPDEGLFSPFFLGYYINSEVYHSKLIPLIQGIKVCSIGKQAIQNTTVIIPSINEQNAIASVLVNADKEIEIQKQKLAAMQEQKKGLMQVLLTGERRIIIN